MDISVVTATRDRPKLLALACDQFRRQALHGLTAEHIVVSDGPDTLAQMIAEDHGAQFAALDAPRGEFGAPARDRGVCLARGRFVTFWDDDNLYNPSALASLSAAASGADVGICRCRHLDRLAARYRTIPPAEWDRELRFGEIDTMCAIVDRQWALRTPWSDGTGLPGYDFRWLSRLQAAGARLAYSPVVIGDHL